MPKNNQNWRAPRASVWSRPWVRLTAVVAVVVVIVATVVLLLWNPWRTTDEESEKDLIHARAVELSQAEFVHVRYDGGDFELNGVRDGDGQYAGALTLRDDSVASIASTGTDVFVWGTPDTWAQLGYAGAENFTGWMKVSDADERFPEKITPDLAEVAEVAGTDEAVTRKGSGVSFPTMNMERVEGGGLTVLRSPVDVTYSPEEPSNHVADVVDAAVATQAWVAVGGDGALKANVPAEPAPEPAPKPEDEHKE